MTPERQAAAGGRRVESRQRHRGQRVSAEPRLVRGAVEGDERGVDRALIERVEAGESRGDLSPNPVERILHVEAAEALSAIALVDRLARAARRAGRRYSPPHRAVAQRDFRFDGRAAARVPDAPGDEAIG